VVTFAAAGSAVADFSVPDDVEATQLLAVAAYLDEYARHMIRKALAIAEVSRPILDKD
jgi:hypothetical protein